MTNPDLGIQINTVAKTALPFLDSENRYLVRYRVKTADGNATTSWSPVYRATKPSIETLFTVGGYEVTQKEIKSHGRSFDVSWKITPSVPEQIDGLPLDVYVKWDDEDNWNFVVTTTTNSFSIPIPNAYISTITDTHYADFMVHLATVAKERLETDVETLVLYSQNHSTRAQYDAGSITP
jgi:hypothetical protein